MSAESDLFGVLSGDPGVSTIVGARIYPDFIGQEIALPACVYVRTATEYVTTIHDNTAQAKRMQFDVWCMSGTSRADVETLADAIEVAIAPSAFTPVDRRHDFDGETEMFVTVMSVQVWK